MESVDVSLLIRATMLVMLKLGGPVLLAALTVGLIVALVQAVMQINEATLAFLPKLLAVGVVLTLLGPFMTKTLTAYAQLLFAQLILVGGS